jgi:hypothetical protein
MISYCGGMKNVIESKRSLEEKEALWDRYYTTVPERQRRCIERYKIVKRA